MKLSGPQSDRDRKWSNQEKPPIVPSTEKPYGGGDGVRLQEENNALKSQLKRALKELQRYQNTYPSEYSPHFNSSALDDEDDDDDEGDNVKFWSPSMEKLKPLFEAYDTRIGELEDANKQQTTLVDSYKQKIEVLIRENEELRSALSKQGPYKASASSSATGYDLSEPLHVEIITELQEQVDVLRGENSLLMEQRGVMMVELEQYQTELKRKTMELQQQSQQLVSALSEVKSLTIRSTQAEKDREAAANQALHYSQAVGKAELQREDLMEQLAMLKQKCKESESLVVEFKKQLRSLSTKTEDDANNTLKRVLNAENRVHELHTVLVAKTQELEAANELTRKLRSEYQNTRQDAEGMLQVMGGLERQLNEYASREAEVEKKARAAKEVQEEALILKEQCAARDEQNKREIDRLVSERKLMALRRKDELEKAIEQGRKAMNEQIAAYEHNMDALSEKNAKLIFETEKANRNNRSSAELYEKLQKQHEEDQKSMHVALKEIGDKLAIITRARDVEIMKKNEAIEQSKECRITIEKLRSAIDDMKVQSSQNLRSHESIEITLKSQVKELQRELSDKTNSFNRKNKEYEDVKELMNTRIAAVERKYQDEIAILQRQITEAHKFAQEIENANEDSDRRTQSTIAQLKDKYLAAMTQLEARVRMESDNVKMLHSKIRNTEAVLASEVDEKNSALRSVEVTQNDMKILEEDLALCRSTISELSNQLASSHQAREEGAIRAARTIEQLNAAGAGGGVTSSPSNNNRRSFEEFKDSVGLDGSFNHQLGFNVGGFSRRSVAGSSSSSRGEGGVNPALQQSTDSLGSIPY